MNFSLCSLGLGCNGKGKHTSAILTLAKTTGSRLPVARSQINISRYTVQIGSEKPELFKDGEELQTTQSTIDQVLEALDSNHCVKAPYAL